MEACRYAWVSRELAEHQLKVFPNAKPIKQRLRRFTPEKREAITVELTRLKAAGFIREVMHPEWLANPVLVLKKNKKDWRMRVDYTDLNKHCPKDPFELPRIDQVIDSTAGCALLSILDCYSGYHQISLAIEDQEKTTFIMPFGAYCYTSMSFGLKNAEATYQRAIQTYLADHYGKRVEAYIEDIIIKTKNKEDFIDDLRQVFDILRKFQWKLNPTKCIFGVPAGQSRDRRRDGAGATPSRGTQRRAGWTHSQPQTPPPKRLTLAKEKVRSSSSVLVSVEGRVLTRNKKSHYLARSGISGLDARSIYASLLMARTKQTTRKATGARATVLPDVTHTPPVVEDGALREMGRRPYPFISVQTVHEEGNCMA
ncbi:hypothetical protein U9M48_028350 [Paspalum notatum var. saurae]|uniref:Reverse transcriptase domain-containing protein n=1 Tax=Paspalum notatum var. saurae TaxID=547442 RepID=A0AAQ3TX18_PASNO